MGFFKDLIRTGKNFSDGQKRLWDETHGDGGGNLDENGKKHGIWIWRHSNGEIRETGQYSHGSHVGTFSEYNESGLLTHEFVYPTNVEEDVYKSWQTNFLFRRYFGYSEGRRYISHEINGRYSKDVASEIYYYSDGQISLKSFFGSGFRCTYSLQGEYVSYHEDGKLGSKGNYINDEKNGLWVEYYSNGQLKSKGNWEYYKKEVTYWEGREPELANASKMVGDWVSYNEDGTVSQLLFDIAYGQDWDITFEGKRYPCRPPYGRRD
jgi:antitoxin component YwqK of YwqJK toxin-antitoxin module